MDIQLNNDILKLFQKDANKAFRSFFDVCYPKLRILAFQYLDNIEDAEDLVQNFFVLFGEKKLYLTIENNLMGYAYLCIRNEALKRLQKEHLISTVQLLPNDEQLIEIAESYDIEDSQVREYELKKALDALPDSERRALYGVVLQNKSYKIVAEELNISVNTLKSYLTRAMRKLRANDKLLLIMILLS